VRTRTRIRVLFQTIAPALLLASGAARAADTVPAHVLTGAYVAGYRGTAVEPARLAPYLSWAANPAPQRAAAVKAAGLRIYAYTDPNRKYPCPGCSFGYSTALADRRIAARDCAGTPIRVSNGGILVDPRAPQARALFRAEIAHVTGGAARWDAVFEDDTDDVLYTRNGLPCGYDAASWRAASREETAQANIPVIFNGLSIGKPELGLLEVPNVIGGMYEGCYTHAAGEFGTAGDAAVPFATWLQTQEIELAAARRGKLFWCYARAVSPEFRAFEFASFMLAYDPATSLLQEDHPTPSGFPVFPETQLVALDPVGAPRDAAALRSEGGAYVREYRACYRAGIPFGACAFAVNPTGSTQRWLSANRYRKTARFRGGGVLEGGTVSFDGPPPSPTLSPGAAVIALRR
jgi:hypothetical protein